MLGLKRLIKLIGSLASMQYKLLGPNPGTLMSQSSFGANIELEIGLLLLSL